MCGLGDVESVGTNVQGQEENTDTGQGLERSKTLLRTSRRLTGVRGPHAERRLLTTLHSVLD